MGNKSRRENLDLEPEDFWKLEIDPKDDQLFIELRGLAFPPGILTSTVNDGKNIPRSFSDIFLNEYCTYVPGDVQSIKRRGFIWPGTNAFLFISDIYSRPLSERDFEPESERSFLKKEISQKI